MPGPTLSTVSSTGSFGHVSPHLPSVYGRRNWLRSACNSRLPGQLWRAIEAKGANEPHSNRIAIETIEFTGGTSALAAVPATI